jgi:hypothetical protein
MKSRVINISTERLPSAMGPRQLRNLEANLEDDLRHFEGRLPERAAIAWHAFLSAMMEWRILVFAEYRRILTQLPPYPSQPIDHVLLGRAITYQHDRGDMITPAELELLTTRIRADVSEAPDALPESLAVAWHAYISALQVHGVLTLNEYQTLVDLLPKLSGEDPIDAIVLGRD